jgi:phosphoenolpyruvate carboxylase
MRKRVKATSRKRLDKSISKSAKSISKKAAIRSKCGVALAKTDMYIARRYARLHGDNAVRERISSLIESEQNRSRQAILEMTGEAELLACTPWFQGSIRARVPYIDLLNMIQIELLQRRRARPSNAPE